MTRWALVVRLAWKGLVLRLAGSVTRWALVVRLAWLALVLRLSLNAAMIAGERAALGVIKTLEGGVILDELTSDSI